MNELVKVDNQELVSIEWDGERVITTSQLADIYETSVDNIKMNFSRNQNKFTEGKHFYLLKGEELKDFKSKVTNSYPVKSNVNQLYLWTKRGSSRHCKILGTEKAWEQFDYLEEAYFNPIHQNSEQKELSPLLQELISIEHRLNESERKLVTLQENSVKQTEVLRAVKDTFTESANQENFSQWVNDSISEIANSPVFSCHNYRYQEVWGESYKRLTNKAKCNLDTQLKNARKRAAEDGATKTKVKNISKLQIIANDKKLKELYISVLREMKIAYCVEIA